MNLDDETDNREELKMTGNIKLSTYTKYFEAAHSHILLIIIVILFILAQFALSYSDYFLANWWVELFLSFLTKNFIFLNFELKTFKKFKG